MNIIREQLHVAILQFNRSDAAAEMCCAYDGMSFLNLKTARM